MTKQDRADFDAFMRQCEHYRRIAIEQCIAYGLTSKTKELAQFRAEAAQG